ncbi:MAG: Protein PhlB [Wolbachia endosymbiont of Ctenocephalides orientis wCori]|nr:MAG: Protein PhlB [Wolbachia endosymbiont of Ctenocephalides orientis wCori]
MFEIAKILLTHKAQVNFRDERFDDRSLLHHAASQGKSDIAKLFLEYDANVNATNKYGNTALHISEKRDLAEFLIDKGADINAKNEDGDKALHIVEKRDLAKFLIDKGADINAKNEDGNTPLHRAVQIGNLDLIRLLIESGDDINAINNDNKTPLDYVNTTSLALVNTFLKHSGKANRQGFYTELLNEAVQEGDLYLIKCSLQNGADVNVIVIHASTQLFYCFYYQENMDAVKLIVNHIAKLESAGLYVSPKNLELKNKLKDPLCQEYNSDIASSYE